MSELIDQIAPALEALWPAGTAMVVATSGGPDSQALLDLCARAGRGPVVAAGADHGLRPEARAELAVAEQLAARQGLPFRLLPLEVERKRNLLAAARRARYAALLALCEELGAGRLAVAHNANDQ